MMKRMICLLLIMMICALSLTAWAQDNWQDMLSDEEKNFYHAIDGSTATIPLSEAIALRRLGITQEQASQLIHHNTTAIAYDSLLNGYNEEYGEGADLIFVTAPSDYELESAKEHEVELEFIPVAHDALVFLNNVRNPVTSLTQQQLRGIYTGKITSWKDVGGEDEAIIPFQRPDRSGSQTLFDELLMGKVSPMVPPEAHRPDSMGLLVDEVSNYENGKSSLGYSVYYYVTDMYGSDSIRLLAIDGVLPTAKTIIDHSYPFFTYYYAVLRKDTPADSPYRELVKWLLTDEGQKLVADAGYIPMRSLEVAP